MSEYAGQQFVGIDLHRQRSVIVRTTESEEVLESVRILNDVTQRPGRSWVRAERGRSVRTAADASRKLRVHDGQSGRSLPQL